MFWKTLQVIRILSLDIAIGCCVGALFFFRMLDLPVHWPTILCLGAIVWLIYTADHLLDGQKLKNQASKRHLFHNRFRWRIATSWLILALPTLWFSYHLPHPTRQAGLILGSLVLVYFVTVQWVGRKPLVHKELLGAIIYSSGVAIPVLALPVAEVPLVVWFVLMQFFLVVFTNLVVFALKDFDYDISHGFRSLPQSIGVEATRRLITWLIGLSLAIWILGLAIAIDNPVWLAGQIIIGTMIVALGLVSHLFSQRPAHFGLGLIADSIFLFPSIILLQA